MRRGRERGQTHGSAHVPSDAKWGYRQQTLEIYKVWSGGSLTSHPRYFSYAPVLCVKHLVPGVSR